MGGVRIVRILSLVLGGGVGLGGWRRPAWGKAGKGGGGGGGGPGPWGGGGGRGGGGGVPGARRGGAERESAEAGSPANGAGGRAGDGTHLQAPTGGAAPHPDPGA